MPLVAGSYERFLFGLNIDEGHSFKRSFTLAAHKASVKCLAAAGQYLVSGGVDDLIHAYDMRSGKDLGYIVNSGRGGVTSLALFVPQGSYTPTHLISGSDDGTVAIYQAGGSWELLKTMKGHKKSVNSIAIHPSGQLALTVSRDSSLKLWNLVKGRSNYTAPLEIEAQQVMFDCKQGTSYVLLTGNTITLHAVGEEGVVSTMTHTQRALCMAWCAEGILLTGTEDGSLYLWHAENGEQIACIPGAHATRIKSIAVMKEADDECFAGSASSDGIVKLWRVEDLLLGQNVCLAEEHTRARLTALCAIDPVQVIEERVKNQQQAAVQRKQGVKKPSLPQSVRAKPPKKGSSLIKEAEEGTVDFVTEVDLEKLEKKRKQVAQTAKKRRAAAQRVKV